MSEVQLAAQHLAVALAGFRLAERDAVIAIARIADYLRPCEGCFAEVGEPCHPFCLSHEL